MNDETNLPYGLWPSPISPAFLSQGLRLGESQWDTDGNTVVWLEGRSDRGVLVAWDAESGEAPRDLTDELSVRARVGYGGGDFCVGHGHVFFMSNGRMYRLPLHGGKPTAITPNFGDGAAPALSPDGKHVLYVYSFERKDGLGIICSEGRQWPQIFACGRDFYMQPRWSSDGRHVAYVAWNHPQMPWDGSELFLTEARSVTGGLPQCGKELKIAGARDYAVLQPEFSPDGRYLSYLSDEDGWFNLHLYDLRKGADAGVLTRETSAQLGGPAWVQGLRTYAWNADSSTIYCVRNERGISTLQAIDAASGETRTVTELEEYSDLQQPCLLYTSDAADE